MSPKHLWTLFAAGSIAIASPASAQYFLAPDLATDFSRAYALSADGKAITGVRNSAGGAPLAFRWRGSVTEILNDLPGGGLNSFGFGISGTGGRIVGQSSSSNGLEAFRYIDGPMVGLGDLPGGIFESVASAVDDAGNVVVGSSQSASGREAFILFDQGGNSLQGIGDLPGGAFDSAAFGVSGAGGIVVGYGTSASGREAFRWNLFQGFTPLGDLAGGSFDSVAYDISDTGVVVGRSASAFGNEAFRWTSSGGMVGLGDIPGGLFGSVARSVSSDGRVIVGQGHSELGDEALVWAEGIGTTSVRALLGPAMPTGWTLRDATGVSRDGLTVAGWGINAQGQEQAWIAYLGSSINWVGGSGDWGVLDNWTGARLPFPQYAASIQAGVPSAVTIQPFGVNANVLSLTLGSPTVGAASASLTVLPGGFGPDNLQVNAGIDIYANATLTLAGGAGAIANTLVFNRGLVNGSGTLRTPSFVNLPGGVLRTTAAEQIAVTGQLANLGIVEVRGASGSPATLQIDGAAASGENPGFPGSVGRFDLEHAEVRFLGGFTNSGLFNANGGSSDVYGGFENSAASELAGGPGELNVAVEATVTFNGGVSNYGVSQVLGVAEFLGPYDGVGLGGAGTVRFGSVVQPGGAGTLPSEFGGDVELLGSASLVMTILGTDPATQIDKLDVAGGLTLGGVLSVTLQEYAPMVGDTFDLFDAASFAGGFDAVSLPSLAGLSWDASMLASSGVLSVAARAAGDFNADGLFDAADYAVWAANLGAVGATPSQGDATGDGVVDLADYTVWRDAQVGATTAIPEPASALQLLAALLTGRLRRRG